MSLGGAFDALESLMRQRHERSFAQISRIAHSQAREATNPNKLIPNVDLSENRGCIRVMVDLPGVLASDIDVTIDHGVLCIEGSRNIMDADDAVVVKKQKFTRRYAIDTDVVDCAGATAVLANGVLTFRAPKKERKLQVVRVPVVDGNLSSGGGSSSSNAALHGNGHPLSLPQGDFADSDGPGQKPAPADGAHAPGKLSAAAETEATAETAASGASAEAAAASGPGGGDWEEEEGDGDGDGDAVGSSEESSGEPDAAARIDPK
jgi:HSP20 family molecular chaperone IbpA